MDFTALSHNQLMAFLAQHPREERAWRDYLRRFDRFVHAKVNQECEKGRISLAIELEDLVWEVHEKVLKSLRIYVGKFDNSIFDYLAIISANTVKNHFRYETAASRPPHNKSVPLNRPIAAGDERRTIGDILGTPPQENDSTVWELQETIKACLRRILQDGRHARRDLFIAVMRFILDMKAEQIAEHPEINLSHQSVHRIINELRPKLQQCLKAEMK